MQLTEAVRESRRQVSLGVAAVRGLKAPEERAVAAHEALEDIEAARRSLMGVRATAARELHSRKGWSYQQLADLLGLTRSGAQAIVTRGSPPDGQTL